MNKTALKSNIGIIVAIGSIWGLTEFAFGLVAKYGGALSGEHGDGRVRSPFLEGYFGPQVYNALREVKRLFDPAGLMNPGIIVDIEVQLFFFFNLSR